MTRIGTSLLKETRASQEDGKSSIRKDILSLLVQANTMQGIPEAQRMKDEDIIARAYKTCFKLVYLLNMPCRDPHPPHRWSRNNKVQSHPSL